MTWKQFFLVLLILGAASLHRITAMRWTLYVPLMFGLLLALVAGPLLGDWWTSAGGAAGIVVLSHAIVVEEQARRAEITPTEP